MIELPNIQCSLEVLNAEDRHKLETGIRKLVGLGALNGTPIDEETNLLVINNFPYCSSASLPHHVSGNKVTLSELKEIISNARQQ